MKELWGLLLFFRIYEHKSLWVDFAEYDWRLAFLERWNNEQGFIVILYPHACHSCCRQGHMQGAKLEGIKYIIQTQNNQKQYFH